MQVVLCSENSDDIEYWQEYCVRLPEVTIHGGDILDLQVDAIVLPTNGFALVPEDRDVVIETAFGNEVMSHLRMDISHNHFGELPVRQATIVSSGVEQVRFLIAAPVVRCPQAAPGDCLGAI